MPVQFPLQCVDSQTVWQGNITLFKEKAASGFRTKKKQVRITTIHGDTQLNGEPTFCIGDVKANQMCVVRICDLLFDTV
jgi:hypothetical protein